MKKLSLPTCLAFALLCSLSPQAWAEDPPASPSGAQKDQKKPREQKQEQKQVQKQEQVQKPEQEQKPKQKQKQKQKKPAPFVDRNGDGIQDGKEHRFRGRHRRGRRSGDEKGERRRQHGKRKAPGQR